MPMNATGTTGNSPISSTQWQDRNPALLVAVARHPATAWVVLALSLLVTAFAWHATHQILIQRAHDRFQFQAEEIKIHLAHRMSEYEMVLRGGVGLFAASQSVKRDEWHRYVASLDIQRVYPGIQGLGFSKLIPPGGLAAHEASIRAEGFPDYQVQPAGERPLHTAIIYLEPFDWRNQRAFGYDMFSEPVRHEAMERARDSGRATLSGIVRLVQETDEDVQKGFLMYSPVYRNGAPADTLEQRRAALDGFVYSPFRIRDLLQGILGGIPRGIDLEIFDGDRPSTETQLIATEIRKGQGVEDHAGDALFKHTLTLETGGRVWTLHLHSLPDYVPATEARLPQVFALGGTIASLLLFLYIRSLSGQHRRALALAQEMTAELRDSEESFRTLVEFAPDAIIVIDEQGIVRQCNPAGEHFFGYRVEELIGRNLSMLMPSPHREAHDGYIDRYLAGGKAHIIGIGRDVQALRKDGSLVTIHLRVGEQHLADGHRRFIGFIRDLSERQRAEEELQERKSLFRNVIETSADGFWITDTEGRLLEVNDAYCRFSGYRREELLGMRITDLEAEENSEETATHMGRVMRDGNDLFETSHRTKDGRIWPLEVSVTYAERPAGRLIVFCRDITDRKLYEAELLDHRQHLEKVVADRTAELQVAERHSRLILESTADGIYGLDNQGCFTFVNPAACRLLGYGPDELIDWPVHETIHHSHPDGSPYPEESCNLHRILYEGKALRIEHEVFWRSDGQPLHVAVAAQPLWHNGKIEGAVVSFTEIQGRIAAEAALRRQAQELREQNEVLEKFNRITVGREMVMIRLKRQVNELAQELGREPPHDLSFVDQPLQENLP